MEFSRHEDERTERLNQLSEELRAVFPPKRTLPREQLRLLARLDREMSRSTTRSKSSDRRSFEKARGRWMD